MKRNRLKHFADQWFLELAPNPPIYGPATRRLTKCISNEPEQALQLILALIQYAPNVDALGWVGAGPLEDLLGIQGPVVMTQVEEQAMDNLRFRISLGNVWLRSDNPLYKRVRKAAGLEEF